MGFWPVVLNVLRNSDVVLMVVDARVPSVSRNSEILSKVEKMGKRLVLVFNKIDLVSGEILKELKAEYPDSFFVSALKKRGVGNLKRGLVEMAADWKRESLRIGIVGYPNAGKSALINVLVPGSGLKVKNVSGTTKKTAWIRSGALRIMDSPGVIPAGDNKVALGLTAAKDPHKMKNVESVAMSLLKMERVGDSVRKFYGVDEDEDWEAFEAIGRAKGFLLKGGVVDEDRTAVKIVEDWQKGRISLR
ncbi:GTPase RsgA [Methanococcoides sp. SA1]|nr:GTPase RsgA [Methanococcoides sp. SA1]